MSDSKVFMFPENGNNNSIDPALLMAMNGNGGFGGNNWMWIFFLWFLMPLINGGNWGFGNNRGGSYGIENMINNDAGRELLMQAIQGNGTRIGELASMFGTKADNIQCAINQATNAIQSGNTALMQQISQCCCENRLAICQQTNTLQNTANQNTITLRDNATANTNAILAKLDAAEMRVMQDKLDALREKNSALIAQLSNEHQTALIQANQAQVVAPINSALTNLSDRLAKLECKAPETVTLPYSPIVGVPSCVAAQYGLFQNGSFPFTNGIWG